MKKFMALLLAAMMLLGTTAAFAADDTSFSVYGPAGSTNVKNPEGEVNASADTKLFLQVDPNAAGTIDVTVPLVLVFKTSVKGGTAQAPNYGITNNSRIKLAVTKIDTATTTGTMTLKAYSTATLEEDEYKVQLTADNKKYDLHTASHTPDTANGESILFSLDQATKDANNNIVGTKTTITPDMSTGKLSFVTKLKADGTLDDTAGVNLLKVTYTIAVDPTAALGEAIVPTPAP